MRIWGIGTHPSGALVCPRIMSELGFWGFGVLALSLILREVTLRCREMDNSSGSLFTGPILSPLTSYVVLCCDLMELSFSVV